jgi:hypothetical protein
MAADHLGAAARACRLNQGSSVTLGEIGTSARPLVEMVGSTDA